MHSLIKPTALSPVPAWHFAIFRILFGAYLGVHFLHLLPYAAELFSREGMIPNARLNFTFGILPNPLEHWDSPVFCHAFVGLLLILSLLYAAGLFRRTASLLLWLGWACLFNRNNLISNPSIPYVGLLMLLSAIIPSGEPFALSLARRKTRPDWDLPGVIPYIAWFLMALGYTVSGVAKAMSPSWQDGSALWHVLHNPLARPGWVRDLCLALPEEILQGLTWGVLAAELLVLPLCLLPLRGSRVLAWGSMVLMHLGILLTVTFADLSAGMLMIHLFTATEFIACILSGRLGRQGRIMPGGSGLTYFKTGGAIRT